MVLVKSAGLESRGSGLSCALGKSLSLPGPQFPFYHMVFNVLPFSQGWCEDQGRQ